MMNLKKSIISSENKGLSIRDDMMNGNIEIITESISSDNTLGIVLAIGALVKNNIRDPKTDSALKKLKNDHRYEFCAKISDLSLAALDILGIENYTGNQRQIIELINSKFKFLY